MTPEIDQEIHPYLLSTRKHLLDINLIHGYLSKESYWSQNIPLEVVKKSIEHSICFGVYINNQQIAFARVTTDYATFGYLADVFVLETYRGKGISKMLMQFVMDVTRPYHFRRFILGTRDAHTLYEKFGFTGLKNPERNMEISKPDIYKEQNK